ncbi:hypothetical protein Tco_1317176 [Tanacetum coccineum]
MGYSAITAMDLATMQSNAGSQSLIKILVFSPKQDKSLKPEESSSTKLVTPIWNRMCLMTCIGYANLIANLTLDTEKNKTILKQLKKANASLTQELEECKTNLDETNRASVLNQKHDELVKKSLLTKSQLEGRLKEKTKSIQTILNVAPQMLRSYNGRRNHRQSKILELNENARTKKPEGMPISASKPKRKMNKSVATPHKKTVASNTTIQKSKSYYKELYENTNQE